MIEHISTPKPIVFFIWLLVALGFPALTQAATCQEVDFNQDNIVDASDYSLFSQAFFTANSSIDLTGDNFVDLDDYTQFVTHFLETCPPTTNPPQIPNDAIILNPGDNLQAASNNHPDRSVFYLKKGVYRGQKITPKAGQTFIGEKGAILNGAVVLTNPQADNGDWYFGNQTEEANPVGECLDNYPRCNHEHELFLNNQRLRHVENRGQVEAGTWYFDYGANRVYLGDDPRGKTVELSVTDIAFLGWGKSNNTVKNLIFEKYATPAQRATVECVGDNCLLEYNEFRNNHASGFRIGPDGVAQYNYSHHNGNSGYGGFAYSGNDNADNVTQRVDALYYRNEIAYNNMAGFEVFWGAGGGKVAWSNGVTFRENYSHHNVGPGFWSDIDVKNIVYDGNISVYNAKHGIQHEISFDAEIKNNFVAYNSQPVAGIDFEYDGGNQIYVQSSQNTRVFNNTVIVSDGPGNGILISAFGRGYSQIYEPQAWTALNNQVYDNKLYSRDASMTIAGLLSNQTGEPFGFDYIKNSNSFSNNDYYLVDPNRAVFNWGGNKNFSQWQANGQDTNGSVSQASSFPEIPAWNYPVGPQ